MLTDNIEHVIKLPSTEQISIRMDNEVKHMDLREPHQILILSMVLDHIMDLKQNTDEDSRLPLMIVSVTPLASSSQDNPLEYKPKYIIYNAHSMNMNFSKTLRLMTLN